MNSRHLYLASLSCLLVISFLHNPVEANKLLKKKLILKGVLGAGLLLKYLKPKAGILPIPLPLPLPLPIELAAPPIFAGQGPVAAPALSIPVHHHHQKNVVFHAPEQVQTLDYAASSYAGAGYGGAGYGGVGYGGAGYGGAGYGGAGYAAAPAAATVEAAPALADIGYGAASAADLGYGALDAGAGYGAGLEAW